MSEARHVLWLCDHCGDNAECEPGDQCEVCCTGTIQVVPVVPVAAVRAWIAERRKWTENAGRTPSERTRGHGFALDMLGEFLDRHSI